MTATIHVIARYTAKAGKEDLLKAALAAAVPATRRELGCYQYDLLVNPADPRDLCFVERWDDEQALDEHLQTAHIRALRGEIADLVESPPDVRRYVLV
jgi:quinol monooxygenase YgiN